jgi:TatD DNase family protein
MLIDAHAHLTHPDFQGDLPTLVEEAKRVGIEAIVNICTDPDEVEQGLALCRTYPEIYTVAATTPHDADKEGEAYFPQMERYAHSGVLVAIGETGLDYHHYSASKEIQKLFLRRYLQLAIQCHLPVVIHCREAFADLFQILDEEYVVGGLHLPGMLHCFTGTLVEAKEVVARGWYLSLSGIVTFKKSQTLQEVAKYVPLDQLVIETDAPYLAPLPYRGKRNVPAYLIETARFIASLRGISFEELAAATSRNARTLFGI